MVDQPPFPLLPQHALATVHDAVLALLPALERNSGRHDQAEASLLDPCASPSDWLAQQVNRDADLVDACADAEQLAMILRGRLHRYGSQSARDHRSRPPETLVDHSAARPHRADRPATLAFRASSDRSL